MQWEYCTHAIKIKGTFLSTGEFDQLELTRVLNSLGEQHWELVSSFVTAHQGGGTSILSLIFKRPMPPPIHYHAAPSP